MSEEQVPPPAVPLSLTSVSYTQSDQSAGVKQASPDIVVFDESSIDPDYITQSFFDEFGGTELIKISRYDLINGDEVSYNPIKNIGSLRQRFNSKNIIDIQSLQQNPTKYGINLFSRGVYELYFNENGDLVIEIEDIRPDESIEVQIASDGTIDRIDES